MPVAWHTPTPIQTLELSNIGPGQFLDGRPLGNSWCCWRCSGFWCWLNGSGQCWIWAYRWLFGCPSKVERVQATLIGAKMFKTSMRASKDVLGTDSGKANAQKILNQDRFFLSLQNKHDELNWMFTRLEAASPKSSQENLQMISEFSSTKYSS